MAFNLVGVVSPTAYGLGCAIGVLLVALAILAARTGRRRLTDLVAYLIGCLLIGDVIAYLSSAVVAHSFSWRTSLPLALCNAAVVVAALACLIRNQALVEITWFVGIAGTLQAVVTPDLSAAFPHLVFFEYLVGHLGVVAAAAVLVVGLRIRPRARAWLRVYLVVAGYSALVGIVDAVSGANYMFLRHPPSNATLLSVLGPFPWYIASAAGIALVAFFALSLPFAHAVSPPRTSPRSAAVAARMYGAWVWTVLICIGLVVWPAIQLVPSRHRWALFRRTGRVLSRLIGIAVVAEPFDPPDAGCLFVANHASVVDGLVLAMTLPRPATIVVGAVLGRQRIAGPFLRALDCEFVGPLAAEPVRSQLARVTARLEAGKDVVGFPEGGLGAGAALRRLHLGLFVAAASASATVVPVALQGTGVIVAPGTKRPRKGAVRVRFGSPIATDHSGFASVRTLTNTVGAELTRLLPEVNAPETPTELGARTALSSTHTALDTR